MGHQGRAEQWWWWTVGALLLLFAVSLIAWWLDMRTIDRESVWAKPLKFEVSLALHFATLAFITSLLDEPARASSWLRSIAIASAACTAFEMAYIIVQAARQQASHFNLSTPFLFWMYVMMAGGAVVITMSAFAVGWASITDGRGLNLALRIGIAVGLIGGSILTLITAFRMGGALNHHVGSETEAALRMPITGWSLTVGDRRVPHFFATHMMQSVPVFAAVVSQALRPTFATVCVVVFAILWIAATLFFFIQANAGWPIQRFR